MPGLSYQEIFMQRLEAAQVECIEQTLIRSTSGALAKAYFLLPKGGCIGCVITLHGTGNDAIYPSGDLFLRLLEKGFAVFTLDLDGHGAHSTTLLDPAEVFSLVKDAKIHANAAMQKALGRSDLPFHLLGLSLGGAIALGSLTDKSLAFSSFAGIGVPRRVELSFRLLLTEVLTVLSPKFWQMVTKWGLWPSLPALSIFKRDRFPIRTRNPEHLQPYRTLPYLDIVNQILVEAASRLDHGQSITLPVLLIGGSQDQIAPFGHCTEWLRAFSNGTSLKMQVANHFTLFIRADVDQSIVKWFLNHQGKT